MSSIIRNISIFFKFWFVVLLIVGMVAASGVLGFALLCYVAITRDLPKIEKLSDYHPKAVTKILSDDGELIAEAWDEERRYPVSTQEIPVIVKNAFLAAEDANFYNHPGIDLVSIIRAIVKNFKADEMKQGASTITQQIVKSLVLTREKKLERKIKEAILAYKIERTLSKDEILTIYLNEIFLGATAYGVKAASNVYFHKELSELNIAEAAFIAGLPQRPSYLAQPEHRAEAISRQHYVLDQLLKNNMITKEQKNEALAYELKIQNPNLNKIFKTPYFSSYAVTELDRILSEISSKLTSSNPGGYVVHTTSSVKWYNVAEQALRKSLKEIDKRRGWRGSLGKAIAGVLPKNLANNTPAPIDSITSDATYTAIVTKVTPSNGIAEVRLGDFLGTVNLKAAKWANRYLDKKTDSRRGIDITRSVGVNDIIEVSLDTSTNIKEYTDISKPAPLILDQTPQIEGAFVLSNVLTGEAKVIIGGYDFRRSQFNRATQSKRQPGSAFKPFIYLGAVDYLNYSPTTMVPDSPISLTAGNGKIWSPQNYDREYLGPITMRTALQRSRNVVSVHLLNKIGVDRVIEVAERFGITTPIGRNLSIALGTSEVKPIELVRAYGAFASGGWLADRLVISKIEDRFGNVIYQQRPKQKQVISEDSAFIMANMMKGVVERGTAQSVSALKRPMAGKTGTTSDQMDAWFIGYNPEWVAGVWVGFDEKLTIGKGETGGRVAAPAFLYFMQEFLKDQPILDFEIPDGVIPMYIDLNSGHPVDSKSPGAFLEYFKNGTEPTYDPVDLQQTDELESSEQNEGQNSQPNEAYDDEQEPETTQIPSSTKTNTKRDYLSNDEF